MGLPVVWRKCVRGILASSQASVLINGSPTLEFQCFRGVRQGDPLSPFIFIIAREALIGIMSKASSIGLKKSHEKSNLFGLGVDDNLVSQMDSLTNCM
ncbi:hypothetical protein HanXRQr2_Chr16g0767551 [Helianthus annuus]|uniref:Reverse transcriptase domain-containing protein n=1 Tax=Helianthus annuus TaxID=4232 RepID=A0A251S1Y3_HELAN|nr:hypothetical protein HanXRQr2_Chr16g0767551 [Helianthus annuus]KAJ0822750.1 hypothetical protein HanPSC8_Chr16g0735731 [Helianthus annuus]